MVIPKLNNMRLKRIFKDKIFDIINNSEFDINEFYIENPEDGEYISIVYSSNNNRFVYTFRCKSQIEYLLTINSPMKPDFKDLTFKATANTIDNRRRIIFKLAKFLKAWLNQINEEIRTLDKFTQYFNNFKKIKFNGIPESKGKQPPSNTESKILIQQLDEIKKTISNTKDILLDGQEILFDDLEEIREDIKKKQSSLRGVINKIIGAIFRWGLYFAIPSEVVKTLFEQIKDGLRKMLGE